MNIKAKLSTGLATGAFVASMFASSAMAADVVVSGNGAGSENGVVVASEKNTVVGQLNVMVVENVVTAKSNTGGNKANGNTGAGNVEVVSGNATTDVTIANIGGDNTATVNDCGCPDEDVNVKIKDNGRNSVNGVVLSKTTNSIFLQGGVMLVGNSVTAKAKTGKNKANNNTGKGTKSVTSKNAKTTVNVRNVGGSNTLN